MMLFLNLRPSALPKAKRLTFILGVASVLIGNFAAVFLLREKYTAYYMLLVHLPLVLIFWYVTNIHPMKIIFTLFTAVFLIYPANLFATISMRLTERRFGYIFLGLYFVTLIVSLLLIDRFLKKDFQYLIGYYSDHHFFRLFFLPFTYNICTFMVGRYSYTMTTTVSNLIMRSLLFILAFVAYMLVLDISRTDREKQSLEKIQSLLSIQLDAANRQMDFLHKSQELSKIYRHDIRHHLALLSNFAAEGNLPKISEYLRAANADIDAITPIRYCENEMANLLISSFGSVANSDGVVLTANIELPNELSISDTELCSLLSNALENAVTAAAKVDDTDLRKVLIRIFVNKGKLFIYIENPYSGQIETIDGLPISQKGEEHHGLGVKSMFAIVEKHKGLYSFDTQNNIFALRLVLPLKNEPAMVK
ncbi:MAG: ATP-binding protein [Oscillospiraceae bacterium]